MTDETRLPTAEADLSLAGLLDQICDRFETACKGALPPRLEDFLDSLPASADDRGFRELLELELAYRRRAGQTPSADEYRARFPQYAGTIDQLFPAPKMRSPIAGSSDETISARMAGSFSDVVPDDTQLSSSTAAPQFVGTPTSSGRRFRVVHPHAKGGLGEVFIAEDQELHRDVALKQIQSQYADITDCRTRFVLEAEVTGALEHPGIVPVYGLGTYSNGRPFYAMRFIQGDSLKDAIESFHDVLSGPRGPSQRTLELRKLLGRFVDVCDAIEYAHSRGILHRDLKPGNIMLGNFGETLVVDWGLAKQINRPDAESEQVEAKPPAKPMLLSGTAATQMGSAVGTPQYMSPEQAAGRLDLISPRSDVYSLGATLYCLLTGKSPMSDRMPINLSEILRRVQEGDIAPARVINPAVPKPLEAICRKAMAVRPEDRYPSARRLADDIEHWLADEPISAQPDTRTQLVARWIRRHRSLALATAIALLLITLVSTAATLLVNHQRQIADRLAIKNGELAESEKTARGQAEKSFREARAAVDELFTKVSDNTLLNQPGMQSLRKELLQKTLDYYQRFLQQRSDDPTIQDDLGVTYFHVGRLVEELDSPEKGLAYYRQAQQLQEQLLAKSPDALGRLTALGDTYNAIGGALNRGRRLGEALQSFQNALKIRQRLVDLSPGDVHDELAVANTQMNIGQVDVSLNHTEEAEKQLIAAQKTRKAHLADAGDVSKLNLDIAVGATNLGILELRNANHFSDFRDPKQQSEHDQKARGYFAEAIEHLRDLAERNPQDLNLQSKLAICYRFAGDSASRSSPESAVRYYQQARDAFAKLVDGNPKVSIYKSALAGVYMNLANAQHGTESLASFEQARQILAQLAQKNPHDPQIGRDLAVTLLAFAQRQTEAGQVGAARSNREKSLALLVQLNQTFPNYQDVVQKLGEVRKALKQMDEQKPVPVPPSAPISPDKSPPSPKPSSS